MLSDRNQKLNPEVPRCEKLLNQFGPRWNASGNIIDIVAGAAVNSPLNLSLSEKCHFVENSSSEKNTFWAKGPLVWAKFQDKIEISNTYISHSHLSEICSCLSEN